MGGQIIDASIVAAPKQRNTDGRSRRSRKAAFRTHGRTSLPSLPRRTAMRAGRSNTPKPSRVRTACRESISPFPLSATRTTSPSTAAHGLIRTWTATDAARHDGAQLPDLLDRDEHGERGLGGYRLSLAKNENHLSPARLRLAHPSQEAQGQADAGRTRRANARKSKVRSRGRARLRLSERADGPVRPHHRHRQGEGEDRPRQPRLQHAAVRLADRRHAPAAVA